MIPAEERATVDAVHNLLVDWAKWQQGYRVNTGYPRRSCGMRAVGQVVTADSSDEQQDDAEKIRCEIVDRCIDDLPVAAHKAAVHRRYLSAVYRMRDYERSLADALTALASAFRRKGILW